MIVQQACCMYSVAVAWNPVGYPMHGQHSGERGRGGCFLQALAGCCAVLTPSWRSCKEVCSLWLRSLWPMHHTIRHSQPIVKKKCAVQHASSACCVPKALDVVTAGGRKVSCRPMRNRIQHTCGVCRFAHACSMAAYKTRLSPSVPRSSAQPRTADPISAPPTTSEPAQTLLSISADACEAVLSHLNAAELCQCQLVCKALREAACSDSLWRGLCQRTWQDADAAAWLTPGPSAMPASFRISGSRRDSSSSSSSSLASSSLCLAGQFTSCRQLYPVLLQYHSVVGVWRTANGVEPSLFLFRWGHGCIEGTRLTYEMDISSPTASLVVSIGGGSSDAWIKDLADDECTLAIPPPASLHRSPSEAAQAAAAVAANRVRLMFSRPLWMLQCSTGISVRCSE